MAEVVVEEIQALYELAFVVVADVLDTYAVADAVLHSLYKLKSKRNSKIVQDCITFHSCSVLKGF